MNYYSGRYFTVLPLLLIVCSIDRGLVPLISSSKFSKEPIERHISKFALIES
jgi:hypothetical protein